MNKSQHLTEMGQDAEAEDDNHCQALDTKKNGDSKVANGTQAKMNLRDKERTQQQLFYVLSVTAKTTVELTWIQVSWCLTTGQTA